MVRRPPKQPFASLRIEAMAPIPKQHAEEKPALEVVILQPAIPEYAHRRHDDLRSPSTAAAQRGNEVVKSVRPHGLESFVGYVGSVLARAAAHELANLPVPFIIERAIRGRDDENFLIAVLEVVLLFRSGHGFEDRIGHRESDKGLAHPDLVGQQLEFPPLRIRTVEKPIQDLLRGLGLPLCVAWILHARSIAPEIDVLAEQNHVRALFRTAAR